MDPEKDRLQVQVLRLLRESFREDVEKETVLRSYYLSGRPRVEVRRLETDGVRVQLSAGIQRLLPGRHGHGISEPESAHWRLSVGNLSEAVIGPVPMKSEELLGAS